METSASPPRTEILLGPLLASLPAAAVSPQPPTALLPLLSPILRQRVQLLSGSNSDPWLPLLCYDSAKALQLEKVVKNERLEAHPVSGEIEIDWDSEAETKYKRIDQETLQALISLSDLGLSVRLVWCVNDELGGADGWRIGEVAVLDNAELPWGEASISAAEDSFKRLPSHTTAQHLNIPTNRSSLTTPDEDEDDDDYWAQYDKTSSGNTPAPKEDNSRPTPHTSNMPSSRADEDSYYAQYEFVQPAMDNHDPDEAQQNGGVESSLGGYEITRELQQTLPHNHHPELSETSMAWSEPPSYIHEKNEEEGLIQPRPSSSAGSSGSDTVARLERQAAGREHTEVGIKQHIGTSIKSLFRLSKAAGIEREEFNRLIKTELDCLALMDEPDE